MVEYIVEVRIKHLCSNIAHYFFSYPCPGCDSLAFDARKEYLCTDCLAKIRMVEAPYCTACGSELDGVLELCSECIHKKKRPWSSAVSVFHMKGGGGRLIHRFKYNGVFELGRPLGVLAAEALASRGVQYDVIVPIPLHWFRQLMRGYNQSEIIAQQLGNISGKPVEKLLTRTRYTEQQAKLHKCEREGNLIGAFSTIAGANYKKRSILVVDDVMTTGATLEEAAKELLNGGAKEVSILVLARR